LWARAGTDDREREDDTGIGDRDGRRRDRGRERSLPTIKRLEREDGEGPAVSEHVREAVQKALEKAGVEFIAENRGGAGVRLKRRAPKSE
jgi:hypothetical protein